MLAAKSAVSPFAAAPRSALQDLQEHLLCEFTGFASACLPSQGPVQARGEHLARARAQGAAPTEGRKFRPTCVWEPGWGGRSEEDPTPGLLPGAPGDKQ